MLKDLPFNINKLLKNIADDDERAFRLIFDYYKVPFYATAFKMTHSVEIAEDIVQEVFMTLWVKRKLVAAVKKPQGYLFTVLHNCIYYHFRKLALERQLKLKLEHEGDVTENYIETLLMDKENEAILENVINHLPTQQKLIYKLSKQEGLSREEISKRLNISCNTVRNHLSAAVKYLINNLERHLSAIIWVVIWLHL